MFVSGCGEGSTSLGGAGGAEGVGGAGGVAASGGAAASPGGTASGMGGSSGGATAGTTASGGSSAGAVGGSGGAGGASGSAGAAGASGSGGSAGPGCGSGSVVGGVLLHTSFDGIAAVTSPVVGEGAGAQVVTSPGNDFVPGLLGNAVRLDTVGEHVSFAFDDGPNYRHATGTLDFCYQPLADHTDGVDRGLFDTSDFGNGGMRIRKAGIANDNELQMVVLDATGTLAAASEVPSNAYLFEAGVWTRLTFSWDFTVAAGEVSLRMYQDGVELTPKAAQTGPVNTRSGAPMDRLFLGGVEAPQNWVANGLLDELYIYDRAIVP